MGGDLAPVIHQDIGEEALVALDEAAALERTAEFHDGAHYRRRGGRVTSRAG